MTLLGQNSDFLKFKNMQGVFCLVFFGFCLFVCWLVWGFLFGGGFSGFCLVVWGFFSDGGGGGWGFFLVKILE